MQYLLVVMATPSSTCECVKITFIDSSELLKISFELIFQANSIHSMAFYMEIRATASDKENTTKMENARGKQLKLCVWERERTM